MFNLGLLLLVGGLLLSLWWPLPGFFLFLACLAVWVTAGIRWVFERWRGEPLPAVRTALAPGTTRETPQVPEPLEDRLVSLDDPDLPASIREAAAPRMAPGFTLWRCPRSDSRGRPVVEWWLFDAEGGLIAAYWER